MRVNLSQNECRLLLQCIRIADEDDSIYAFSLSGKEDEESRAQVADCLAAIRRKLGEQVFPNS